MSPSPARDRILQRIKQALGQQRDYNGAEFRRLLESAPAAHRDLAEISNPGQVFMQQATAAGARLLEINSASEVPAWLRASEMAKHPVTLSSQDTVQSLDWSGLQITDDYRGEARVGVVYAHAAAAETGTLMQHSHAVPSGLLYLVDTLIVLLNRADIRPRYEDLWADGPQGSAAGTPRAIHLITGPSRTADVEQTIQVGAHGPRELYIVVLG